MTEVIEDILWKDVSAVCRICLKNRGTISIFSESEAEKEYTLQERIMSFAYVEIYEGDGLPSQICKKCFVQINRAFKFKAQCEYADDWLRQFLPVLVQDEDSGTKEDEVIFCESSNKELNSSWTECDSVDLNLNESVLSDAEAIVPLEDPVDVKAIVPLEDPVDVKAIVPLEDPVEVKVIMPLEDPVEGNVIVPVEDSISITDVNDTNSMEEIEMKPSTDILLDHNIPVLIWDNSEIVVDENQEPQFQIIVASETQTSNLPHNIHKKNKKRSKQPEDLHKCIFCDKAFPLQGSLVNHLREHEPTGEFRCIDCGRAFPHEILLDFHIKTHTADRPYCCSHCGKCFMQLATVISHERSHTQNRRFLCSHCGKLFAGRKAHICPMLHDKREKIYQCNDCGKKFLRGSTLATHKKRHGLMERFRCKTCFKPFFSRQELLRHTNVHLGIRPFACDIPGCDNNFYTQGELNRHLRYHRGEKKFRCDLCSQSFYESGHLVNHRRKHTGERPFVCHLCRKTFTDASKLKRHIGIHSANSSRRTSKSLRKNSSYSDHLASDDKYDQSLERTWAVLNEASIEEETIEIQSEAV